MMILVWIVLAVLALGLFVVFGALVELYRTVQQIREQSGALDARTQLDVSIDPAVLKVAGLPAELVMADRSLLLILSDRCSTCDVIADRLAGDLPQNVWLLVQPRNAESAGVWLSAHELETPRTIVDLEGAITDVLGLRISPAGVRLREGEVVAAHTVPSARKLDEDLRWVRKGGADQPTYGPLHQSYRTAAQTTRAELPAHD